MKKSQVSERGLALLILSKMLYAIALISCDVRVLQECHKIIMNDLLDEKLNLASEQKGSSDGFSIRSLPWGEILDAIIVCFPLLEYYKRSGMFKRSELRYMTALICGVTGNEYGIITGFKSHYNVSLSIRHKLNLPPKSTNLRNFLQYRVNDIVDESFLEDVQK